MGLHYQLHCAHQGGGGGGDQERLLLHAPIDCSTSNGIPEQVMCCYANMGKFASKIEGGSSRCTSNGPSPYFGSVPVWARSIIGNGIQKWCPYQYWHYTLVQYQYGHGPLLVLAFKNGARTGTGIFALWFSTSMGTVHYRYWHCMMPIPVLALWFSTSMGMVHYRNWHSIVPIQVLAFLHLSSVPEWAHSITGTEWWKREICRVKEWKEIHQSNRV